MMLNSKERESLIKKIQFILYDEYDQNIYLLNLKYKSGHYDSMSDDELLNYYHKLKEHESNNLLYSELQVL
jgi:hypothetical protein